jgi:hypothetical protein
MNEDLKEFLSLAINYDIVSRDYIKVFIEKFSSKFNNIYFISEIETNNDDNKIKFITNLKSIILETPWLLILNENEFPSLQFLDNFVNIINNIGKSIKIINLPIVIYSSTEDKVIDILGPSPRIFRSNPQLLKQSANDEINIDEIPLIKIVY